MRGWRNRQTRWIQVPVPERAWGFNSPLAHSEEPTERVFTSDESHGGGPFLVVGSDLARTGTWQGPGGEVSHGRGPAFGAVGCSAGSAGSRAHGEGVLAADFGRTGLTPATFATRATSTDA